MVIGLQKEKKIHIFKETHIKANYGANFETLSQSAALTCLHINLFILLI